MEEKDYIELIKERMEEMGETPSSLALKVDYSISTITRILKGEIVTPRFCIIVDICKALHMPLQIRRGSKVLVIK